MPAPLPAPPLIDAAAGTPSLRRLGTSAVTACAGNDSRLTDTRAPSGVAGGSLTGTYPNPTIAAGAVSSSEIATAIKDPVAATAGLRTLGTSSVQACAGNDSRLTDSRAPSGVAGGSLTGTFPNPTIVAGAVSTAEIAAAIKDPAAGTAGLRTLGTTAVQACAGDDSRLTTPTGASLTSAAGKIPLADGSGIIDSAWLALVGPGAGTIGGAGSAIQSVTLDAHGRVTAAASTSIAGFISQAYATVQAAGTPLTQRSTINFGTDFTPVDNSGAASTDVALATQGGLSAGTYTSSTVTVNAKGVVTAIANGSAVSITGKPLTYSIVDVANAAFAATSNVAGNQTTGQGFYNQKAMSCTGVRFYWKKNATNRTFNVAIWSVDTAGTGTKLANVDVAVTTTGVYVGTFSSPVSLAAVSRWIVSVWEKSGAEYVAGAHGVNIGYEACVVGDGFQNGTSNRSGYSVGPYLFSIGYFVAGANTFPGTGTGTSTTDKYFPVEPILADIVL